MDQSTGGKLRDVNPEESWAILEHLALYDNKRLVFEFMASQDARLSRFEADFKRQQGEMTNKIDAVLKAITDKIVGTLPSDTVKNLKLRANPVLSTHSYPTMDPHSTQVHSSINTITTHPKQPGRSQTDKSNIMRRRLNPREDANGGISNFTGRIRGMHDFIGNFTYIEVFMIIKDISLIIYPRFVRGCDEVAYKMPRKIEQYNILSDLEKEHTKSVYLRNEEDKRRGVDYVMSKILGFYKECLELGLEYLTRMEDDGEVI
ncbi:hypothetical protein Tco_0560869 [Tanacetum coccineum]